MNKLIKSWSHSTLSMYEKCPYQLILKTKFKIPPDKYMQRGIDIHKECEDFLNAKISNLPSIQSTWLLEKLQKLNALPEIKYGLTKEWTKETNWDNAYGKCIIDAVEVSNIAVKIVDFKTGKPAPIKHQDQAQIYAIAANIWHPEIEIIETEFWYIDLEKVTKTQFTIKQLQFYQQILKARIERMVKDAELAPKPSKFTCKWCQYKNHCEYHHA